LTYWSQGRWCYLFEPKLVEPIFRLKKSDQ